jgi:selT/selW/selH-like putative selenoprotein
MARGIHDVVLKQGGGGVFEITVDGQLAFSKKKLGRFPEEHELDALLTPTTAS